MTKTIVGSPFPTPLKEGRGRTLQKLIHWGGVAKFFARKRGGGVNSSITFTFTFELAM